MLEEDPGAQFAKGAFDRLILRRTKDECLDLPEKTFVDVRVDLPSWQRKLRLLAADTIEDAIVKALERKSAMARTLLGDEEAGPSVAQFTKEQMCELLLTNRLPDVD
jgi:SNF2 family DNA or RNA helicase